VLHESENVPMRRALRTLRERSVFGRRELALEPSSLAGWPAGALVTRWCAGVRLAYSVMTSAAEADPSQSLGPEPPHTLSIAG